MQQADSDVASERVARVGVRGQQMYLATYGVTSGPPYVDHSHGVCRERTFHSYNTAVEVNHTDLKLAFNGVQGYLAHKSPPPRRTLQ